MTLPHLTAFSIAPLELVIFAWGCPPQRFALSTQGTFRIGRNKKTNDVAIIDSSVSRNHAILTVGPKLTIQDLGSSNGTFLRKGEKDVDCTATQHEHHYLGETFSVELGDRISFGSVVSMVQKAKPAKDLTAAAGNSWAHAPVVRDPVMLALYDEINDIVQSSPRMSIMILGDTGVGKEVLAETIHRMSSRARKPFVAVSCVALSETLIESELFGHKRGAFTGASYDAPGYFEKAHTGTLFLDEIGEIPLKLQAKLLRVLETRTVTPVGSTDARPVDVRIIAATNKRLEECVARGTFRQDLYFRLRGFELEIPPLAARPLEIIPLAEAFLAAACQELEQPSMPTLSPEATLALQQHPFTGNVRELRNAMHEALARCRNGIVLLENLPAHITGMKRPSLVRKGDAMPAAPGGLSERQRIERALHEMGGNVTRAAKLLGMSTRTLHYRLKALGGFPRSRERKSSEPQVYSS